MALLSSAVRALILPALCTLVLPASAAGEPRPYSVDLMLKSEGVGEVAFSPRGDRLLLEKLAAYDTRSNFSFFMFEDNHAMLLEADLAGKDVKPLGRAGERTWLTAYSPDGTRAVVGWLDGTVAKAGIYDTKTGTLRKLDLLMSVIATDEYGAYWLSEDEFILFSQSAQMQRRWASRLTDRHERMQRLAQNSWRGDKPGVTALGSGKHGGGKAIADSGWFSGTLLRVDARTGKSAALGSGPFWQLSLSPDRRRFAVLREVGDLDLSDVPGKDIRGRDKELALVVYDLPRGGAEIIPCKSCNVTLQSLRWSPGGSKLFFSTQVKRPGRIDHKYYTYDFRRAALERFAPKGLALETVENLQRNVYVTPFVWLTEDTPAVRVTRKAPPAAAGSGAPKERHDWYALPPGRAPVALTAGLELKDKTPLADFVAVHKGKLLIMADGDLWQLSPDGTRKNLTQAIAAPLSPWCSVMASYRGADVPPVCSGLRPAIVIRPVDQDALAKGWLTFRVMKDDVFTGDVLLLNIDSGKTVRIARPDPQAELVSASALAHAAVYNRKGGDGDRLLLVSADGATRELLHINQHLAGVVGGKPVLLTRREPGETEERYDWLLLPPDHKPGQRQPLLVYFYPGATFTKELPRRLPDLRQVSMLNMHIPAARGYAVLLASVKISEYGIPANTMTELHGQLIRAAENAVHAGYADPERWALMGHSYGGYGTNSVITQTNRFKAAVASAGTYNLTSFYGSGPGALDPPAEPGIWVNWAEGGQGRMGAAPWQDPQRYIANSPLFHAHKIQTPLMLIHGNDDIVHVTEAEQMFNALLRQNKDAVFLRYWGEGHTIESPANIRDLWTRIIAWLDEHLGVKRDGQGLVALES